MIRVLHLGIEPTWRGGENQIRLLVEGLNQTADFETAVAYPRKSEALKRFAQVGKTVPLSSSSPFDPRNILKLSSFCKKQKIDIINCHSSAAQSLGLNIKALCPKLKLVVHRRVDNPIRTNSLTRKKYLSPKVDAYVAISKCIQEILINYGVEENKAYVVRSAVDPEPYTHIDKKQARQKYLELVGKADDTILIGTASALTDQKGIDVLIRSCEQLKHENLDFHVFIAGKGEKEIELKALSKQLGLEDYVSYLGFIENVPELLKALDILAMPSNSEGLGTLLLDAIFAGCAVAATRVGGIPEAIIHQQSGLLSDVGDHKALAQNISNLIRNKELRNQLNEQGQHHIAAHFSLESMVQGNMAIYQKLCKA